MAAELADAKDIFLEVKDCSKWAFTDTIKSNWYIQFLFTDKSFAILEGLILLSLRGLPSDTTHTVNLKIKQFDICISTSKHMDKDKNPPWNNPEIDLQMALKQFEFSTSKSIFVPILWFPTAWNDSDKIESLPPG